MNVLYYNVTVQFFFLDESFVSEAERFPVLLSEKKTLTEVDIFMFIVITSSYKIIQLSRSPFSSVTINLNKIIYLFLTIIIRDPPYRTTGS